MKLIPLRNRKGDVRAWVKVDDEDFDYLNQYRWCLCNKYAFRKQTINGKERNIYMHTELMGFPEKLDVDHIDGDKLNNQRSNLRIATRSQNNGNRGSHKGSSSKYRGVSYEKQTGKWVAQISSKKIGRFVSEEDAALAYNEAAIKYFGEFAYLNVIDDDLRDHRLFVLEGR